MSKSFRSLRKLFPSTANLGKQGFTRAKTPRTPSSELFPFAAFAPLREIFRFLLAV
jgi:hypothetical protein